MVFIGLGIEADEQRAMITEEEWIKNKVVILELSRVWMGGWRSQASVSKRTNNKR